MYTEYYGFREKPFNIVPDPTYLYLGKKHRSALTYLKYGLAEGSGFILLTGEVGIGKTTLVKHLLNEIETDIEVAVIFHTNVTGDQLLEMILQEFELESAGKGKTEYLKTLNEFLIDRYSKGQRALLIVDEAQNLSIDALEEIRMLSNLHSTKDMLLQIFLVGQPNLQVKLKDPSLYQLTQRIAVKYHLPQLNKEELEAYVKHRLKVAGGGQREVFAPGAYEALFKHTEGIPRKINVLCDAALVYGFADQLPQIDAAVVDQVVRDEAETGLYVPHGEGKRETNGKPPGGASNQSGKDVMARVQGLEEQVVRLSSLLEGQLQGEKPKGATDQDELIKRLKAMLKYERKKNHQLMLKYKALKARLDKGTVRKQSPPKKDAQPPGPRKVVSNDSVSPVKIDTLSDRRREQGPPAVPQREEMEAVFYPSEVYKKRMRKKTFTETIMGWFKSSKDE